MNLLAGVDIGGTKCAVVLGCLLEEKIAILGKRKFATPMTSAEAISKVCAELDDLLDNQPHISLKGIGISCGGPLDSHAGLILSPPNLPTWDQVNIVKPLAKHFRVPVKLQNDANAGALAEWLWGAGRGCHNMIFLTFGTGMGAGLILNGQLYSGTSDLAGEVGHVRLATDGPEGYGKHGSFEGFCSGGGIANLARMLARSHIEAGMPPTFCPTLTDLPAITAEKVGHAARAKDPLACNVFDIVGRRLGQGLAMLVDILNPERIVIGSIYGRQQILLQTPMLEVLHAEALSGSASVCEIVPAELGEQIGDLASLSVALDIFSGKDY